MWIGLGSPHRQYPLFGAYRAFQLFLPNTHGRPRMPPGWWAFSQKATNHPSKICKTCRMFIERHYFCTKNALCANKKICVTRNSYKSIFPTKNSVFDFEKNRTNIISCMVACMVQTRSERTPTPIMFSPDSAGGVAPPTTRARIHL